jgi:hypothetical protein
MVALDLVVVAGVYFLGLWLRFDGMIPSIYRSRFWRSLPIVLVVYAVIELVSRTYAIPSPRRAFVATLTASLLVAIFALMAPGQRLPLSVAVFGAVVCPVVIALARFPMRRRVRPVS